MIRILLIPSSDYLGHPFPQRHNQIFERVNDGKNFEVHVIRFNIFRRAKLTSNCVIHEVPLELSVSSTPAYYLSNAMSHLREILRIIKNESIDVVVAGNLLPPLLLRLYDKILGLRVPFIFDLQDYYPTSATGYICDVNSVPGVLMKGMFERITRTLLRRADVVTVPGIALAMYARRVRGKLDNRGVYIVPNGISEHFLTKHDGSKVRERMGYTENDLVVGYVGSIEFWLDMETLIRSLSEVYRSGVKVRFMLIGGSLQTTYSKKVIEWIRLYDIERITDSVGFVEHEKVPEYVAAMDVGTIPFDITNLTAYYAAPNKMWEYLSQGISVISTPIPEALFYKNLINIARSEKDYIAILRSISKKSTRAINKESSTQEEKTRVYLEKRTWKNSAELFKKIIKSVILRKQ